jgi:fatty-acyl-CoA synthase
MDNMGHNGSVDWIGRWALYSPDRVMLELDETDRRWTYSQADRLTGRLVGWLSDKGVVRGDRVAVLSQNEPEYVFLFFALQRIGAILVPMNFRLTGPEIRYLLDDSAPVLLINQQHYSAVLGTAGIPSGCTTVTFESLLGELYTPSAGTSVPKPPDVSGPQASLQDVCMILYTSGTTGRAKGAMITNGMLFWNSVNTGLRLNLTQNDTTLVFAPFFHTGGWNVLTTPFIHRGARLIMLRKFDPDRVLKVSEQQGVTILFGVPTMMDMMVRAEGFAGAKLTKLRYAIVGGEPMPLPLIETWQHKGVPIRQGYGLTEFGPNVFSLNEEDAIRKIGSIGFPNFYIEARVVDDVGNEVGDGAQGELVLRGPVCMKGYWNNAQATAATIRDGWLHTGDIVMRDAQGYYYVVDRKKDMYISGAENVYPAEVEHVLRTHPAVREVAVIGVPDPKWGESGMAFVVLADGYVAGDGAITADSNPAGSGVGGHPVTPLEIIEHCTDSLAKYKIPRYVRYIDALPKSDSGKVLKRQLRDELPTEA